MKTRRAMLILALVCLACFWGREIKADTVTSGNLSFTCDSGSCGPTGNTFDFSTAPTAGSFVYDNTTNQFLNVTVTWDGMPLHSSLSEIVGGETVYLGLIGLGSAPPAWDAICTAGTIEQGHCGGLFGFLIFDPSSPQIRVGLAPLDTANPEFPNDAAGGIVTATDLMTTPEPTASVLLLMGMGLATAVRGTFKIFATRDRIGNSNTLFGT
jgi:hypothetical protein